MYRILAGILVLSLGACAQTPAERAALNNAIQNFNYTPIVAPPQRQLNCITNTTNFGTTHTTCQQQ